MDPTFKNKEYILTSLISLKFEDLERGDVIVFKSPTEPDKDFIKRIIGIHGDSVYIQDGAVFVNGKKIDESAYLSNGVKTFGGGFMHEGIPVTVPPDNYLVFGDNRPFSSDSREWGFLETKKIIGKSMLVYWPLNNIRGISNPYGE